MTVSRIARLRKENKEKYGPANELKPVVIEILKGKLDGLTPDEIIAELRAKLKTKTYSEINEALKLLFRSKYFQKEEKEKRRMVYKLKSS